MENKPPGHNWKHLNETGDIIQCIDCRQAMVFYHCLDPRDTLDADIFDQFEIAYPIINSWVVMGWGIGDRHPTQLRNCRDVVNEINMEKALR